MSFDDLSPKEILDSVNDLLEHGMKVEMPATIVIDMDMAAIMFEKPSLARSPFVRKKIVGNLRYRRRYRFIGGKRK